MTRYSLNFLVKKLLNYIEISANLLILTYNKKVYVTRPWKFTIRIIVLKQLKCAIVLNQSHWDDSFPVIFCIIDLIGSGAIDLDADWLKLKSELFLVFRDMLKTPYDKHSQWRGFRCTNMYSYCVSFHILYRYLKLQALLWLEYFSRWFSL